MQPIVRGVIPRLCVRAGPYVGLAQGEQGLQDLVVQEVLHAGARLPRLPLLLLLGQDVQHLLQVGRDVGVGHRGLVVWSTRTHTHITDTSI